MLLLILHAMLSSVMEIVHGKAEMCIRSWHMASCFATDVHLAWQTALEHDMFSSYHTDWILHAKCNVACLWLVLHPPRMHCFSRLPSKTLMLQRCK